MVSSAKNTEEASFISSSTNESKNQLIIRLAVPIAFGIIVFCLGWLSMFLFWNHYGRPEYRGFTYFESGFFGDSLFLPPLIAGLLAYILNSQSLSLSLRRALVQERSAWTVAILAALAGSAMQFEWLLNDATALNWTIPQPHYFNGAGWWHAGFFVFIFAVVGYLSTRFFIARFKITMDRSARNPNKRASDSPAQNTSLFFIVFGAAGYIYLRQYETAGLRFEDLDFLLLSLCVILFFWIIVCSLLCLRFPGIKDLLTCTAGAISAYGVAELAVGLWHGEIHAPQMIFALAFALLSTCLVPFYSKNQWNIRVSVAMTFLTGFGMALTFQRLSGDIEVTIYGFLSVLMLVLLSHPTLPLRSLWQLLMNWFKKPPSSSSATKLTDTNPKEAPPPSHQSLGPNWCGVYRFLGHLIKGDRRELVHRLPNPKPV